MPSAPKGDTKAKKAAKQVAPWNPEWGWCKGVDGKHAFPKKGALFAPAGGNGKASAFTTERECINCPTKRRTVYVRGEAAVHTYTHPPGYKNQPAGSDGHMIPRREIRDQYIQEHQTKRKS